MSSDLLVLVHGLKRTRASMWPAAIMARRRGYAVLNWGYPSARAGIMVHAEALRRLLDALPPPPGDERIHFLTHSLGGIIVRALLARASPPNVGRVVMLGPPNAGNEIAERLGYTRVFRRIMGPAGVELGTGADSVPRRLPEATFELGVIAGVRRRPALFGRWIGTPNDGLVSVSATRLVGMRDHLVVHGGHALLPANRRALSQAFTFLAAGHFARGPDA
ncbi:MAG TPA: alpha/beta fold hydrolase [Gemmatimonadaceae bacterium]|nr:alpha/beta fold hydrolase [Gemmatimonadaceae bacterium]